jgi:hypothetical protein
MRIGGEVAAVERGARGIILKQPLQIVIPKGGKTICRVPGDRTLQVLERCLIVVPKGVPHPEHVKCPVVVAVFGDDGFEMAQGALDVACIESQRGGVKTFLLVLRFRARSMLLALARSQINPHAFPELFLLRILRQHRAKRLDRIVVAMFLHRPHSSFEFRNRFRLPGLTGRERLPVPGSMWG